MPILAALPDPPPPPMSEADKAKMLEYLDRAKSAAASQLSNLSLAYKIAETTPTEES